MKMSSNPETSRDIFRIVDANFNRIGEGLRVLEEFARLSLNDTSLTQQLKNLRHRLINIDRAIQGKLIAARDSESDIGSGMNVPDEPTDRNVETTIIANSRRVQESLRVMEEIAKSPELKLDSETYRRARFEIYTLEKELISRLLRKDKVQRLSGLYVVIDTAFLKGRSHKEVTIQAIRGGAKTIQLRAKNSGTKEFFSMARDLKQICAENNVLFIINDSLEIALASEADGLHIGQDDLPISVARKLLPIDKILGCSASNKEEALDAASQGADYLGVGSIYPTSSKDVKSVIGEEALKNIHYDIDLPIVAIGGINLDNIASVIKAGAISAAVISAVLGADDVEAAAGTLTKIIERAKNGKS
jgi:thiamine-phosphate pyrophosphorylase